MNFIRSNNSFLPKPPDKKYAKDNRYHTDFEDEILPSQASKYKWLQFTIDNGFDVTGRSGRDYTGKWMIFQPFETLDKIWPTLKTATYQHELGVSMKSSTHIRQIAAYKGGGLICVYTKTYLNILDVKRVLYRLRELDISWPISYKADEQTRNKESGSLYNSEYGEEFRITLIGRKFLARTPEGRKVLVEYS
jgi:hypothetical protein